MSNTSESPAGAVGLRERKKLARREALADAALRLADRDGLDAATVEAICAEAGVSTRTFFNYFETKDDAVLGIEPLSIDPAVAETFAAGGPTGRLMPDLEALVGSLLGSPSANRSRRACVIELIQREPRLIVRKMAWMEHFRASIEDLVARRLGPGATPERIELIGIVVLVVARTVSSRREADGDGPPRNHARDVVGELRALLSDL